MNDTSKFFFQVFEKIGAPLFTSVGEISSRKIMTGQTTSEVSDSEQAEIVAKLLTNITQAAASVTSELNLENKDPDADDLQISLAAILSPVVANQYQLSGQPLTDNDISRIATSFQTLATFSDNFSSLQDGAKRLEGLSTSDTASDETQAKLKTIMSTVPLINAVAAFSFGETPEKLLKKIITRIETTAKAITKDADPTAQGINQQVLQASTLIYSQCHFSEMAKIMAMSDQDREKAVISIDNVWTMFDHRIDMLSMLVKSITGEPSVERTEAQATPQEETPPPTSAETPPSAETVTNTTQAETPPAETSAAASGNPMSFFAKKTDGTEDTTT